MKIGTIAIKAIHIGEVAAKALAIGANKVWQAIKWIVFKDPVVEQICATNWGDGEHITPEQAANVTDIGTVFQGNTEITSFDELEIFGIKHITEFAFKNCTSLKSIKWPKGTRLSRAALDNTGLSGTLDLTTISNTVIPYWLCINCKNLEEVIIGDNVTELGMDDIGQTFGQCTALRRVEIKGNAIKKLISPFVGCTSLEHVEMPDTVEYFGSAFEGCTSLTLPSRVLYNARYLGGSCFVGVTIEGDVDCPYLETLSYGVFRDSKVRGVVNLGKITQLSGSSIYTAFFHCQLLEYVILPSTVMSIADYTFSHCRSMRYIIISSVEPPTLGTFTFNATPSTMSIYVPDDSVEAYKSATNWSNYAEQIKPLSEYQE